MSGKILQDPSVICQLAHMIRLSIHLVPDNHCEYSILLLVSFNHRIQDFLVNRLVDEGTQLPLPNFQQLRGSVEFNLSHDIISIVHEEWSYKIELDSQFVQPPEPS